MAFVPATTSLGFPPIAESNSLTSVTGRMAIGPFLGRTITAIDTIYGSGDFIYLHGAAATARGSVVFYDAGDFTTALAAAGSLSRGQIAVAMSANGSDSLGWYQLRGKAVAKVLTGFAVLTTRDCYLTATPGSVDDAGDASQILFGMMGSSAVGTPSAGLAEVDVSYPFVRDGL